MTFSVKDAIFYKKLCWNWFLAGQSLARPTKLSSCLPFHRITSRVTAQCVLLYTYSRIYPPTNICWERNNCLVIWFIISMPGQGQRGTPATYNTHPSTIHLVSWGVSTLHWSTSAPCTGQPEHSALVNLSILHWSTWALCTGQPKHPALVNLSTLHWSTRTESNALVYVKLGGVSVSIE